MLANRDRPSAKTLRRKLLKMYHPDMLHAVDEIKHIYEPHYREAFNMIKMKLGSLEDD